MEEAESRIPRIPLVLGIMTVLNPIQGFMGKASLTTEETMAMADERWRALLEVFRDTAPAVLAARRWVETQGYGGALGAACTQRHARGVLQSLSRFVPELLAKPVVVIEEQEGAAVSVCNRLWIQTLPSAMQTDILSFLAAERRHFLSKDLVALASGLLAAPETDFWVRIAASRLLNDESVQHSPFFGHTPTLKEKQTLDEYNSLPGWLEDYRESGPVLLSQIPPQQEDARTNDAQEELSKKVTQDIAVHVSDDQGELPTSQSTLLGKRKHDVEPGIDEDENTAKEILGDEFYSRCTSLGAALRSRSAHLGLPLDVEIIMSASSSNLPLVLKLVQPWLADDETTGLLVGALLGEHSGYAQSSQILTHVLLPKLASMEEPPSRTLLSAALQAGKAHPRAAVDALIIPLLRDGSPVKCDLVGRVVKECFTPEAASALCNRMFREEERLVWTEGTVGVVHSLLSQKVALEEAALEALVSLLELYCHQFAGSLKFSNLVLNLVGKYGAQVRAYKAVLLQVGASTKTFLSKSILAKVNAL